MAIKYLDALVMRAADLDGAVAFYRAIGLPLQEERHADAAFEAAIRAGGRQVLPPDEYPWGRRALVEDPDGRTVELNCAPAPAE